MNTHQRIPHSLLCAVALLDCCIRFGEAETEHDRSVVLFEEVLWNARRKATEN